MARLNISGTILALGFSLALLTASPAQERDAGDPDEAAPQVGLEELSTAPTPVSPSIQAPVLPGAPESGKGRMSIAFEGNRRWCTYPDDRVVTPPAALSARPGSERNPIYTFGYQFTIAATRRSHPEETLLLFESPVYRTAVYRLASKVNKGRPTVKAPAVDTPPPTGKTRSGTRVDPTSYVPWWQEQYRCTTLPEVIDLDLEPGVYDVYMAFDILLRSGNWSHRTIGFGTDIAVEADRLTRVDARANMASWMRRDLEILGATITDVTAPAAGR
jgi:hypothetical protein